MNRLRETLSSLRIRVPATAIAVFAISLAVAAGLAYELFLQDGRRDADVVQARETERFELSISGLLDDELADDPDATPERALRAAVARYLQLNPSTESYWTIVRFADGPPLAAYNGPPELEPLFERDELPQGPVNERATIATSAGDVRTMSTPVLLGGEQRATLQIVTPLEPVRTAAREAAGLVAAAAAVSLLLGGILLTASLWRSLAPLGDLARAARSTELRSLDARVEEPDTDDEVAVLAREFNTMLERIDRASLARQEFMASIGHELRTPITIARGHLEVLETLGPDRPDALRETAAIVRDELTRMGRLVDDLMAIARSDMDDFVRPRDVELVQWFEELELRLAGIADVRQVRISPPPPLVVRADPDRLAQAVLNLVANARTHTPPGTRVQVTAQEIDERLVVTVTDDGPGIPAEIRDTVFAPFVRSGDAPGSTGLGLAVVKAVIDAHGGGVVLRTGHEGTAVELWLPLPGTDDEPAHDEDEPARDDEVPADADVTLELPASSDADETRPTAPVVRP